MRASPQDGFLILFLRVFLGKWSVDSQRLARQLLRGYCSKRPDLLRGYCSKRGHLLRGYCSRFRTVSPAPSRRKMIASRRGCYGGIGADDAPRRVGLLRGGCGKRSLFLQGYCGKTVRGVRFPYFCRLPLCPRLCPRRPVPRAGSYFYRGIVADRPTFCYGGFAVDLIAHWTFCYGGIVADYRVGADTRRGLFCLRRHSLLFLALAPRPRLAPGFQVKVRRQ